MRPFGLSSSRPDPTAPRTPSPKPAEPFNPKRIPPGIDVPNLPKRSSVLWMDYDGDNMSRPLLIDRIMRTDASPAPVSGRLSFRQRIRHSFRHPDLSYAANLIRSDHGYHAAGFRNAPAIPAPPGYENGPPPRYNGMNLAGGHMLVDHSVGLSERHESGGYDYWRLPPSVPGIDDDAYRNFGSPTPPYGVRPVRRHPRLTPSAGHPDWVVPEGVRNAKSPGAFTLDQAQSNQLGTPPPLRGEAVAQAARAAEAERNEAPSAQ